jgi:hypothetical protein
MSARSVLAAAGAAFAGAAALLVVAILPAEYGWDPLGTGAALGLLGMADTGSTALSPRGGRWAGDEIAFELDPFESVEYKYRLAAGEAMLFDWRAGTEVLYDFHAEPDGAAPGYAESVDKGRARRRAGSYVAPFDGIHGWFWQNRGQEAVTVRLVTRGYYDGATEFRGGRSFDYDLAPADSAQP